MSDEELLAKVRQIRQERRISRKPEKTQTKAKRMAAKDKLKEMLSNLSKEEIAALLGGKK